MTKGGSMSKIELGRISGESEIDYICRIASMRGVTETIETWYDVCDILNEELDHDYDESTYRKKVRAASTISTLDELDDKVKGLYKQEVRTRDALREYRKHLRDEARVDALKESFVDCAKRLKPLRVGEKPVIKRVGATKEAILMISDWHIGAKFDNFLNSYSLEIAKKRVDTLIVEVLQYCEKFEVTKLHVVNLGDMVEGNIHVSIRVMSEFDVVEQTMRAAELIAYLLEYLSDELETVHYRQVLDNHSRININKDEHIEKESFAKLIGWWLSTRIVSDNIIIENDNVDDNIGAFELENGKQVAFVHGHLDRINQVFQNLGGMLRKPLDYILMGHYHVAKFKEFNGGKVFVNGSLKGVDPYALNKRYMGKASQFLFVIDGDNEVPIAINL